MAILKRVASSLTGKGAFAFNSSRPFWFGSGHCPRSNEPVYACVPYFFRNHAGAAQLQSELMSFNCQFRTIGRLDFWELTLMPRRRKKPFVARPVLAPAEIEARIMALVRKGGGRRSIKGITIVYVGSFGREPNWFARPVPAQISSISMKKFVSAFAQVRQVYDLLVESDELRTSNFGLDDFAAAWT